MKENITTPFDNIDFEKETNLFELKYNYKQKYRPFEIGQHGELNFQRVKNVKKEIDNNIIDRIVDDYEMYKL